jgi:molybdopterin-guanine dinucleotide biosynthesis protein A
MDGRIPSSAVLGLLLAGGRSERMGGDDKCLVELGGRPLLAHAIERLRPQVGSLVLNANGDARRFARFDLPVVADTVTGFAGPLAGILAGMLFARDHRPGIRYVATAATDSPFFPGDLVARLSAAMDGSEVAIARCRGRGYPVFGLFPVGLAGDLAEFLAASSNLAVMAWIDRHAAQAVEFEAPGGAPDPFINVNTPDDLAAAEALIQSGKLHKP